MPDHRILFIAHHWPFPPDSGGRQRTYYTLRSLADEFQVQLVALDSRSSTTSKDSGYDPYDILKAIQAIDRIETNDSPLRKYSAHFKSSLFGEPYTTYLYDHADFVQAVRSALRSTHIQLVHVDTYHLYPILSPMGSVPVSCTFHDLHSEILFRRANIEHTRFSSVYLELQAERMKSLERRCAEAVDLSVVVSERDKHQLENTVSEGRLEVIPNGLPLDRFAGLSGGTAEQVVFVGSADWYPNHDAMRFFASDILPQLRRTVPDVSVTWVGSVNDDVRREFEEVDAIRLTGRVEDVRPYVGGADCVVVPLRCGSGTRLKILEAWAMKKAVVSTSIGCEGLAAEDGGNILIRDEPDGFADAVAEALMDNDFRRSLGAAGLHTVQEQYDWNSIGNRLVTLYSELIQCG